METVGGAYVQGKDPFLCLVCGRCVMFYFLFVVIIILKSNIQTKVQEIKHGQFSLYKV